jgi:hypothetical protein
MLDLTPSLQYNVIAALSPRAAAGGRRRGGAAGAVGGEDGAVGGKGGARKRQSPKPRTDASAGGKVSGRKRGAAGVDDGAGVFLGGSAVAAKKVAPVAATGDDGVDAVAAGVLASLADNDDVEAVAAEEGDGGVVGGGAADGDAADGDAADGRGAKPTKKRTAPPQGGSSGTKKGKVHIPGTLSSLDGLECVAPNSALTKDNILGCLLAVPATFVYLSTDLNFPDPKDVWGCAASHSRTAQMHA